MTDDERPPQSLEHAEPARSLASLLRSQFHIAERHRSVIAIAGESGSGKSATAMQLGRELRDHGIAAVVLHQDDYFHRPPRANHEHRARSLASVGPQEVNLALMRSHIAAFRNAIAVDAPAVDYAGDTFLTRRIDFSVADVLIVEGTYVLGFDDDDVRIFFQATSGETSERRRQRNRDIDDPVIDEVLAIEHELIAPQAACADILIDTAFKITRSNT